MHSAALHLLPVVAAEKGKFAFYVAGGLLAVWAVVVSVGLGLRMPDFPRNAVGERAVIGVTTTLVVAAMATAVLTAGVPASAGGLKGVSGSLSEAADPGGLFRFTSSVLKAPAGTVTISFTNASPNSHNLTVAQGATTIGATPTFQGGSRSIKLHLKPGSYVFYCSLPGHRQAGMQGTLTVN